MDKRIKEFKPEKIMNNEDIQNKINDLIVNYNELSIINKILELIPKEEGEDKKQKQKDIKYIYEHLFLKGKENKLKEIEINLKSSFWEKVNEYALKKVKIYFYNDINLNDISKNEEDALKILETIYKYIPPELNENKEIKFMPNQYGKLLEYINLSEEKDLNQNFKDMLKNIFNYDISYFLKYKKLNYPINKELSINENIMNIIKKGFKDAKSPILEKMSKEIIKFYPKIEGPEEENYVIKFIDCYKSLTEEEFEEEEIMTDNINIWDKAIETLSIIILKKLNEDKNLNKTSERIELDEDKTIEKLNIFYLVINKAKLDKIINKDSFIPNEKGEYLKLNEIYGNEDIDDEIKEVLTIINEAKSFDNILIHHKIQLNRTIRQKKLEDIAPIIDKEIKKKYNDIDSKLQIKDEDIKIDENLKKGCQLLLHKWFKEHQDKKNLFEFISKHLVDISVKILFDEETKNILDEILISDPEAFIEMIKFQSPNAPFFYTDESTIDIIDESSFDATRDNSINQRNQINFNLFNFNNNNVINHNNNNNAINHNNNNNVINHNNNNSNNNNNNNYYNWYRHYRSRINYRESNNNNYIDWARIRYEEGIKKYCKTQAYIYEKLLESHIFNEIVWINRISEDQEGELIILENSHRYKVKKTIPNYEFTVKTNQNKRYKIKVKIGENSSRCYLKYKYKNSEWNSFKNESESIIFALVSLKNENNPDIIFTKNLKLNEL